MFENHRKPVASIKEYHERLFRYWLYALLILIGSLMIGVVGYHILGHLAWIDALLNASMILTGMGPVDRMTTNVGKIFSAFYAIFSGVAFLSTSAVLLAPIIHRFLHKLHVDNSDL